MDRKYTLREIVDLFMKARLALASAYPYFSHLLFALNFDSEREFEGDFGVAVIDRSWRIRFSPKLFNAVLNKTGQSVGEEELAAFILYHECLHALREHLERKEARNPTLWNIACDLEVNPTVRDVLPSTAQSLTEVLLFPDQFELPDYMPAEWYYDELQEKAQRLSVTFHLDWIDDSELHESDVSELTKRSVLRITAREIIAYNKKIGRLPAELVRWAEEIENPVVPWEHLLRRFIQRKLGLERARVGDYTYMLPSKKTDWARRPVSLLPSVVSKPLKIAVIIDTSGSMSSSELGQAVAEVRAICRATGYPTIVISCDADVHKVERFWGRALTREKVESLLVGGGGTNMVVALRKAQDELGAHLAIVLTDGYSDWEGANEITIPTIVVGIGENAAPRSSIPQHFHVIYTHKPKDNEGDGEQ